MRLPCLNSGSDTITDTVRYGADVLSNASLNFLASTLAPTRSPTQFDTALTSSQTRLSTSSHQPRLRRPVVQCSMLVSDARGRRSDTPLLVPEVGWLMIKTRRDGSVAIYHSLLCQTETSTPGISLGPTHLYDARTPRLAARHSRSPSITSYMRLSLQTAKSLK